MSRELVLDEFRVDQAIDQLLAHEKTVTDNAQQKIFANNVGRWRGLPKEDQLLKDKSPFLWIWQGDLFFKKEGVETLSPEGNCDLIFILAQYLPKFEDNEIRTDVWQKKNALLKKFERTLISSKFSGSKDAMTYPSDASWYFINGPNVIDTEKFYYGGINQIFPFTGLPLQKDWYISVVTSTIYFDNRNHSD